MVHVKPTLVAVYREALRWIHLILAVSFELHNDFLIPYYSDNPFQSTAYLTFFAFKRFSLTP
jgi:hypothetical protein